MIDEVTLFNDLEKDSRIEKHITLKNGETVTYKLGSPAVFGTPAYWIFQWWQNPVMPSSTGRILEDETLYCMLGGHGITGEVSNSYYQLIKTHYDNVKKLTCENLESLLRKPVWINGKHYRYRFPSSKSKYIYGAMKKIQEFSSHEYDSLGLRNKLVEIKGVGLKTASWIVRNLNSAAMVAVVDIHLHRAGQLAGFYSSLLTPEKDYLKIEEIFIQFCKKHDIPPGGLDLLIWNHMRMRAFKNIDSLLEVA